ncbi:MAG: hypothetical protein ACRDI1_04830, partial [Actinomycetota bacterium]
NEAGEVFMRLLAERPDQENSLTAFEESLVQLSAISETTSERGTSRLLQQLMQDDPVLRVRRSAEMERWTGAIASALAKRKGRENPDSEDQLAAAICMATVEQIGREWRALDVGPVQETIRKTFATTRAIVEDATQ